jgi:hypothetical protein
MHPGGFEPVIPASERLGTYALGRAAAEIGSYFITNFKYFVTEPKISRRSLRNWATRTSKSTENLFRLFYGFFF